MNILLVRHGESEGNIKHEINDDPKRIVNLTARGNAQAEATAAKLRGIPFTHAYVSQFPRAQQTAYILLQHHSLDLKVDARLNERISGMDGLHVDLFNDYVRPDYLHIKPPKGETFLEQMERVRGFLDEIAARHEAGMVLAVSHENPIVAAWALTVDDPETVMHRNIENCAWLELEWPIKKDITRMSF
ncbi:MAG: histidine phosphatase family protein [Gallionella sp.]|nr:histidine phosphatase family protein [Gallionella sp.]